VVQQTIEAKLPALLERRENVMTCAPVCNGYLPECETAIAASSVVLQALKIGTGLDSGAKFHSSPVPMRLRRTREGLAWP
jgi:hypothetical protein